jgi:predicted HTH transcriptional regulator
MNVMKSREKESNSFLINLITLLSFGTVLFLIMFLKRGQNKKIEHSKIEGGEPEGRVKISYTEDMVEEKLNNRQRRILERIKQEGRLDPKEIYDLAPNVSTRTIRRDMDVLISLGLVSQRGSTKATTYIFTED